MCKFCAKPAYKNDYVLKCLQCGKRYGGDLMCCDNCSSTYYQICMDIEIRVFKKGLVCKFCTKPAYKNDYVVKCPQSDKRFSQIPIFTISYPVHRLNITFFNT
ncbi:hypothetical protein ABFS82_01G103100 [Erythranthe guttata]